MPESCFGVDFPFESSSLVGRVTDLANFPSKQSLPLLLEIVPATSPPYWMTAALSIRLFAAFEDPCFSGGRFPFPVIL